MKLNPRHMRTLGLLLATCLTISECNSGPHEIQPEGLPCAGGKKTRHYSEEYIMAPPGHEHAWGVIPDGEKIAIIFGTIIRYRVDKSAIYFPHGVDVGEWSSVDTDGPSFSVYIRGHGERSFPPGGEYITTERYCYTDLNGGPVFIENLHSKERR
jgi:hypothetical protein